MTFKAKRVGLYCSVAIAALLSATAALGQAVNFDVPSDAAINSIPEFARQAGIQIVAPSDQLGGVRTHSVKGNKDVHAALQELLAGTSLEIASESGQTVMLRVRPKNAEAASDNGAADLMRLPNTETVVVTGTNIRGEQPTGEHLMTFSRKDLQSSGYATVQDFIKSLPQNFAGSVGESFSSDANAQNLNGGSAIDLRGLGGDATLVLVDGHRQPTGGINGVFTDVSLIPTSAIERVEILPDGASAIYGSDAIGGVVNFILRKDFNGVEVGARVGTFDGDASEYRFSALFGKSWTDGSVLAGYQFYQRDDLLRSAHTLTASDNLASFGGTDFRSFNSNPGNILDFSTLLPDFAIPSGQNGTGLTPGDFVPGTLNREDVTRGADLLPSQSVHSGFLNFNQDIGENIHIYAEGQYTSRQSDAVQNQDSGQVLFVPSTNAFFVDPFGGSPFLFVGYNFAPDFGKAISHSVTSLYSGSIGATAQIAQTWQISPSFNYGNERVSFRSPSIDQDALSDALADSDPATAFNSFGDGSNTNPTTLAAIRSLAIEQASTQVWDANISSDGVVTTLPGGDLKLALGIDYRDESLHNALSGAGGPSFATDISRGIFAAYAEALVPVVGEQNAVPFVRSLAVSFAGRYERYSDFGTTFNPKIGVDWAPLNDLKIRGSWGTSFKAPRLADLLPEPTASPFNQYFESPVSDPASPLGFSTALIKLGNNPDLRPETAHTWTLGGDFTPSGIPNLTLSATYYDIDYHNRIAVGGPVGNPLGILEQEPIWAPLIVRNPTPAQVSDFCNSPLLNGSPAACLASMPGEIIDLRYRNLARLQVSGVDLSAKYAVSTDIGDLSFGTNATYISRYSQQVTATAPQFSLKNTTANPPAFRARADASLTTGPWGFSGALNFTGGYRDTDRQPGGHIQPWTTLDLSVGYKLPEEFLSGSQFRLSAVNVFDSMPSFANVQGFGFDPANANVNGRIVSFEITKDF